MANVPNQTSAKKFGHILLTITLVFASLLTFTTPSAAQDSAPKPADTQTDTSAETSTKADISCPEYKGVDCQGYITDAAGVLKNRDLLEQSAARTVNKHGHEIAVIIIDNPHGGDEKFATGIGDTWGVADKSGEAGGIIVVIDPAGRSLAQVAGPNVRSSVPNAAELTDAARPALVAGDYDTAVTSILTSIDTALTYSANNAGATSSNSTGVAVDDTRDSGSSSSLPILFPVLFIGGAAMLIGGARSDSKTRRELEATKIKNRRSQYVDDVIDKLDATAADLPDLRDYHVPEPAPYSKLSLAQSIATLEKVANRAHDIDDETARILWSRDLLDVIDGERLKSDTEVPLDMRATDDNELLDDALQDQAIAALEIDVKDDDLFKVKLSELETLVNGVRPFRVAQARHRFGQLVQDRVVETSFGEAVLSDRAERLLKAAPVIEHHDLDEALKSLDAAYLEAEDKVNRLSVIHDRLPDNAARPAVAAALTDLLDDPNQAVTAYEHVRRQLKESGTILERDRLDIDAIAAMLLINRSEQSIHDFVRLYERHRSTGMTPSMAVEYALAGLSDRREIQRVHEYAESEGIPVAIVAALMRNRRDGIASYKMIASDLVEHGIKGDSRRTIAGILAASLEPAQAERRWLEARKALADLGLVGAYADVAAAFGASDNRGPTKFALAYAAQRQALSRSDIDDADRYAPELAHTGTSRQTDTWTGQPLPHVLTGFDPFTFFYLHWVSTAYYDDQIGWRSIYADSSWDNDSDSWFGRRERRFGYLGGGFEGSSSSWGGDDWSSGSFGGFGGGGFGGGFGGGGGFSGGSSSW